MDSFFGIGPLELIFIFIFALIFLGPERLPQVVRELVALLRQLQAMTRELTEQFDEELADLKELQELDPRRQVQQILTDVLDSPETQPRQTLTSKPSPSKMGMKTSVPTSVPTQALDQKSPARTAASSVAAKAESAHSETADAKRQESMDPAGENDSTLSKHPPMGFPNRPDC